MPDYNGSSSPHCPVCACLLVSSLLLAGATMSQRSSLTQSAHFVRQALTAYTLPFNTIGLYLKAVKNVVRTMSDRIAARGAFSNAEIADGLVEAVTVKAVASGRDAETGDRLLWVETTDSGVFTFRLDHGRRKCSRMHFEMTRAQVLAERPAEELDWPISQLAQR